MAPIQKYIPLILVLTGCAGQEVAPPPEPTIVTRYVTPDCGAPARRDPIELRPVNWRVIDGRFTLSAEQYEDLSYNVSEIWKGVLQLKSELRFYEDCLNGDHVE